jgi:hypothetical protein
VTRSPLDWDQRELSPEEVEAALARPPDPEEEAATLELHRWFTRRYTPAERLRYVREAYRRWASTRGVAGASRNR